MRYKSRSDIIRNGFFIGETPGWLTADSLVAILDKVLTKDPEQRYQTGAEFARDIHTCLAMTGNAAGGYRRWHGGV